MIYTFWLKLQGAYRSVTIWINGLLLSLMPFFDTIETTLKDNLPTVAQWLTSDILKWCAGLILLLNIALRFKTKDDLANK